MKAKQFHESQSSSYSFASLSECSICSPFDRFAVDQTGGNFHCPSNPSTNQGSPTQGTHTVTYRTCKFHTNRIEVWFEFKITWTKRNLKYKRKCWPWFPVMALKESHSVSHSFSKEYCWKFYNLTYFNNTFKIMESLFTTFQAKSEKKLFSFPH